MRLRGGAPVAANSESSIISVAGSLVPKSVLVIAVIGAIAAHNHALARFHLLHAKTDLSHSSGF